MARSTTIITSISLYGGTKSSGLTVDSVSWSSDNGTITLSATVPASTVIGDMFAGNGGTVPFLITGISGAVLTCQDSYMTTDPVTGGSNEIHWGSSSLTGWEATLDSTPLYASGDDAIAHVYDDGGAFTSAVTINGGATVGLNSITVTVPEGERHDGTAGTGARFVAAGTGTNAINANVGTIGVTVEWMEVDLDGRQWTNGIICGSNAGDFIKNNIVHGIDGSTNDNRAGIKTDDPVECGNNIVYDIINTHTNQAAYGIYTVANTTDQRHAYNNTVHGVINNGTSGVAVGFVNQDHSGQKCVNNICVATSGSTGGTVADFYISNPTSGDQEYNMSSDATAPGDAQSVRSVTTADQFVLLTAGSEDFHLKEGSDAIDAGRDLTTTGNANVDIDGFDRDADASRDPWDIGAHEFEAAVSLFHPFHSRKTNTPIITM